MSSNDYFEAEIDPRQVPIAQLAIAADGKSVPLGVAVILDGEIVARLILEEVKAAAKMIDQMEAAVDGEVVTKLIGEM